MDLAVKKVLVLLSLMWFMMVVDGMVGCAIENSTGPGSLYAFSKADHEQEAPGVSLPRNFDRTLLAVPVRLDVASKQNCSGCHQVNHEWKR